MNVDSKTYAHVNTTQHHFGKLVFDILPTYHSITDSDVTSYPVKIRPLDK